MRGAWVEGVGHRRDASGVWNKSGARLGSVVVMAGINCSECAGNVVEGAVTGKHDGPDRVHHERDRAFRVAILAEHLLTMQMQYLLLHLRT